MPRNKPNTTWNNRNKPTTSWDRERFVFSNALCNSAWILLCNSAWEQLTTSWTGVEVPRIETDWN